MLRDFFAIQGETKSGTETKYQTEEQRSIAKKDQAFTGYKFNLNFLNQRHERLLEVPLC